MLLTFSTMWSSPKMSVRETQPVYTARSKCSAEKFCGRKNAEVTCIMNNCSLERAVKQNPICDNREGKTAAGVLQEPTHTCVGSQLYLCHSLCWTKPEPETLKASYLGLGENNLDCCSLIQRSVLIQVIFHISSGNLILSVQQISQLSKSVILWVWVKFLKL